MRVRILSGNETGTIQDLPEIEAEVAVQTGFAERVEDLGEEQLETSPATGPALEMTPSSEPTPETPASPEPTPETPPTSEPAVETPPAPEPTPGV